LLDVKAVKLSWMMRVKNPTWQRGDWKHYMVPVKRERNKDGSLKPAAESVLKEAFNYAGLKKKALHSEL
jgi:hypothetical protein